MFYVARQSYGAGLIAVIWNIPTEVGNRCGPL
jgi:hypothetical protein